MKKLLLISALALSFNAFAQIPTNGLIGYWPFTGNANDVSGNGWNGIVHGATLTTDRFGNANSAYSFDGSSNYIATGNLNLNDTATISAWVYPIGTLGSMVDKDKDASGDAGYVLIYNNPVHGLYAHVGWSGNAANDIFPSPYYSLTVNQWHHCVLTLNNGTAKIYLDNNLIYTQTGVNPTSQNSDTLLFGKSVWGGNLLNGKLDDIRIYNRPLDSTEINSLYQEGLCYKTITVTDTLIINANLTNVNPVTWAHTIKIYPNPSKDHITIDYGNFSSLAGYTLKIQNTTSQTVFTTTITSQTSYVNISTWTGNGVYFVYLIDAQGNTVDVRKIVLQ